MLVETRAGEGVGDDVKSMFKTFLLEGRLGDGVDSVLVFLLPEGCSGDEASLFNFMTPLLTLPVAAELPASFATAACASRSPMPNAAAKACPSVMKVFVPPRRRGGVDNTFSFLVFALALAFAFALASSFERPCLRALRAEPPITCASEKSGTCTCLIYN